MTTVVEQSLAGKGRSRFVIIIGALFAALAAAGLIGMGSHFLIVISHVLDGSIAYSRNFVIYNALWIILFISLLIAGISLIISGARRKLRDLVPGISLYLAGASLIVIGFYLLIYDELIYAVVAMAVGLTLMIVEWFSDTV